MSRQTSSSHATRVCRRHPDLWTLSAVRRWRSCSAGRSLHRRDISVDEEKSTAAVAKTVVLWCASSRRQHLVPTASVRVGDVLVSPVTAVRDLGVYIDTDVTMRTHVTNIVRACFAALRPECATFPARARTANIGPCIGRYQAGPLQLGPCRYCWLPAKPAAVCAECRCSAHLFFSSGIRTHNPTALGPSLLKRTGANPVSVVCSGISLCAWHSTGVSCRQTAADI